MKKIKKSIKNNLFAFIFTIAFVVIIYLLSTYTNLITRFGPYTAIILLVGMVIWIVVYLFISFMKSGQVFKLLSAIQDPDERIEIINELYQSGRFKISKSSYFNLLSTLYYEKEEYDKALEYIREALKQCQREKEIRFGGMMSAIDICLINEATYLTYMGQWDEAKIRLDDVECKPINNTNARYLIAMARARLAIVQRDSYAAREYIDQIDNLLASVKIKSNDNRNFEVLLLKAENDLLVYSPLSASMKLDEILAHCDSAVLLKKAERVKREMDTRST